MSAIPDDVRRFVLASIPSVPYLEAALLFQREPHQRRSVADVARALYIDAAAAGALLSELSVRGLVQPDDDGCHVYAPRDPELAQAVQRLGAAYADDLVGVTDLIHNGTRRSALRFADAFKLRKDT